MSNLMLVQDSTRAGCFDKSPVALTNAVLRHCVSVHDLNGGRNERRSYQAVQLMVDSERGSSLTSGRVIEETALTRHHLFPRLSCLCGRFCKGFVELEDDSLRSFFIERVRRE